jgi:hypothetical protein
MASVGHRPFAIYFAVFMVLAAIIIATIDPGAYHRRYVRWLWLPGVVLIGCAVIDLVGERAHAITTLSTNTANHFNVSLSDIQARIALQVRNGTVRFAFAPGIYLALLAGIIGLTAAYFGWRGILASPSTDARPSADTRHRIGWVEKSSTDGPPAMPPPPALVSHID